MIEHMWPCNKAETNINKMKETLRVGINVTEEAVENNECSERKSGNELINTLKKTSLNKKMN